MQNPVSTYIGGIPGDIPLPATPVTAYYHGCMEVTIAGHQLDFDEALSKHNSIKSHSCPPAFCSRESPQSTSSAQKVTLINNGIT
ncbi:Vitamin K-dependent protein S [Larimichthys crocea]|uniref:Uncharacterized protein n=1 Tax=Larimichthys crocea TaxID=215358 RepID=A0ACD3R1R3_LARCR|nr:Vitamin K-dependent protein S [Larimichthys crocea]